MVLAERQGSVYTWGDNTFGALGHGDLEASTQPRRVQALESMPCFWLAAGEWHTAVAVQVRFVHNQGGHLPKIPGGTAIACKVENALKSPKNL